MIVIRCLDCNLQVGTVEEREFKNEAKTTVIENISTPTVIPSRCPSCNGFTYRA